MPLSEDDQRVFSEIEQSFYAQDPGFQKRIAKQARPPRPTSHVRLAVAGLVVGVVATVLLFAASPIAGFLGFVLSVFCAATVVDHLRQASRARLDAMAESFNQRREAMGSPADRMRDRFRR